MLQERPPAKSVIVLNAVDIYTTKPENIIAHIAMIMFALLKDAMDTIK